MARLRIGVLLLLATWLLFLALQRGDVLDEVEHCHVAWMMGRMHQQPLRDFFQHHQPLLWDLLKVYFVLGGEGPEVLYFGRALVVACALLFAVGSFLLVRNWAAGDEGATRPGLGGGLLAVAPLLLMSLKLRNVVVVRPETVGLPLLVFALVCWTWPASRPAAGRWWARVGRGALAGVLFGAAVYASPRFALLAGAFVLLPTDRRRLFSLEALPLLAAAAGAGAFVCGYQMLSTGRLSDIRFNLEFTSIIYKTGAGEFSGIPILLIYTALAASVAVWVFLRTDGVGKRRFLFQSAYLVLITVASLASTWPHPYHHNLLISAVWLGVMLACAVGRTEPVCLRGAYPWALAAAAVCLLTILRDLKMEDSIVNRVAEKHAVLALLRPGEKVIMVASFHPICAPDASYYGNPFADNEDRLRKTVDMARERRWDLPTFDYLRDIRDHKPALLDEILLKAMPQPDRKLLQEIIDRDYIVMKPFSSDYHCYRRKEGPTVVLSGGDEAVAEEGAPAARPR